MAYFNYYIKYTFYLFVLSHTYARVQESWAKLMTLQILQGEIQPWAPAEGGARVGDQSPPPPLKKIKKIIALRGGGGQ